MSVCVCVCVRERERERERERKRERESLFTLFATFVDAPASRRIRTISV